MITIIKDGKKPRIHSGWIYQTTCPKCGCVFEFENEDLIALQKFDCRKFIKCPCCEDLFNMYDAKQLDKREKGGEPK